MKERKMSMVVNKIKIGEEDSLDVEFWLNKPVKDRIAEITRLRRAYFTWLLVKFPDKIERIVSRRTL
jgi:hypothetical protein